MKSFANFLADMGIRPPGRTLERRNNNKGYYPSNCYWATPMEQGANKRNNRLVTIDGETLHVAEWERRAGLPVNTIYDRLRHRYSGHLLDPVNLKTKTVCKWGHPKEAGKKCRQCVSKWNHEQQLKRKHLRGGQ
jgi:hypothetical protein